MFFSKLGFEKLTESVLGRHGSSGKAFSHGSILGSLFFSYLCGGDCLEDINVLVEQFRQRPDTLLPGADTVGRGLKELAEENIIYKSETSGRSYSFNTAEKLNILLLRMIRRMRLIKAGSHVDLDFDHQFIPSHKFDAKYYNFIEGKSYRLVVQRSPLKDKHGREQTDMFGVISYQQPDIYREGHHYILQ